jgi:hypothetical protein
LLAGAGGGGCCTHREAGTFPFFGVGLSKPAAAGRRFSVATFLLAGGAVGLTFAATCASVALVCKLGRGGMKRARAAAEAFLTSAPPLGFGASGGAPMTVGGGASAVGGIE